VKRYKGSRFMDITIMLLAVVLLGTLVLFGCNTTAPKKKSLYGKGPELSSSDRILVMAPHPDDEGLACAGVIRRAVEDKIPVRVVLMTCGDGYKRDVEVRYKTLDPKPEDFQQLGTTRHFETIDAMKKLGLEEENITFLCYPDGGTNSLFEVNWDYDNLHLGANGATNAPYPFAYEKNAPYCGESVVKSLETIIKDYDPSIIFYPDPEDEHHDHWGTSAFIEYVTCKIDYQGKQYTYLVHKGFDWPFPWLYAPNRELLPPKELVGLDAKWWLFTLSKDEEGLKHKAVLSYKSQKEMMEPFLDAFVRTNELFATYPKIKATSVTKQPDFFGADKLPHIVIKEASRDTLVRELEGLGDITAVSISFDEDDTWLALETRRKLAEDITYGFHLRIFDGEEVKRVDISALGEQAQSQMLAKNSVSFDGPIPVKTKDNRMYLKIPGDIFEDADFVLLSADSYHKQNLVDKTAWRRVVF